MFLQSFKRGWNGALTSFIPQETVLSYNSIKCCQLPWSIELDGLQQGVQRKAVLASDPHQGRLTEKTAILCCSLALFFYCYLLMYLVNK